MGSFNSNNADISAILDIYMYLDVQSEKYNSKTLDYILNDLGTNKQIASSEEYKAIKEACEQNKNLGKMKLVSQSHCDHKANGKDIFNYSGKNATDDPIQACAFKDPQSGDMYVAYRGTGNRRWGDNGQGFIDESTDMQNAARDYFDHVVDENGCEGKLYVTGHSKGGNEAQYVTMTSKYQHEIEACYSFDGQGFSEKAKKQFKKNPYYEEALKKMYSINGDNDPVHNLIGVIIPEENTYYTNIHYTESNGKHNFSYCHDILGMISGGGIYWQRDENGNITHGTENWLSKFAKILNGNIQLLPYSMQGSCAIAVMELIDLMTGGSMDDAHAGLLDFIVLDLVGVPLVFASVTEAAVIYMYDKYGPIGAFSTAVVGIALTTVLLPIALKVVAVAGVAYIAKKVIDSVVEIVHKVAKLVEKAGKWFADAIANIQSFISGIKEWLYKHSAGYKYANANPHIEINTTKMSSYANQLSNISRRAKQLDSDMNSYYWQVIIEWDAIPRLAKLMRVGIGLDFARRLDKCSAYLRDTANDFDNVERTISSNL